mgnify:CR=1 FL=1
MRAFIIEDEPAARRILKRLLNENFPDIEILGAVGSVKAAVEWLSSHSCDIVFMDVELEDGNSFEIFRQIKIDAFVVMTTAYDNYAVKAFEVNSVDYLLKPIDLPMLSRAIQRCRDAKDHSNIDKILDALSGKPLYRERYMIRINDRIMPVNVNDIAWFESVSKSSYVMLRNGMRYIINPSLDEAEAQLNPEAFFRISRSCIIAKDSIKSIIKLSGSRLRLETEPKGELEVSRARVDDFLSWMEK